MPIDLPKIFMFTSAGSRASMSYGYNPHFFLFGDSECKEYSQGEIMVWL